MRIAVALGVCSLLVSSAAEARDWQAFFDRGEILVYQKKVKGIDVPEMVVKAVINAPPEKVWAIVSRCQNYTRTMLRIKRSQELSRRGNNIVCKVTVDMPFPYSDITSTTRVRHKVGNGRWHRSWRLISGDYTRNRGSWLLTRFKNDPKRTMAVYHALAVPKSWIPNWVRNLAQKKTLPKMIKRLRQLTK